MSDSFEPLSLCGSIQEITFYRSVFNSRELPGEEIPEICISGRSNVGKSSLLNRLANRKHLARTSGKPGKTRSLNYYGVRCAGKSARQAGDLCYLVDLPGYGYAKAPMAERKQFGELIEFYLRERRQLAGIIQLLDSRHGPVAGDHRMLDLIENWGSSEGRRQKAEGRSTINVLYVFTKADKLSARENAQLKNRIAHEYGMDELRIENGELRIHKKNYVLFSALTGLGTKLIWSWIVNTVSSFRFQVSG